MAAAFELHHVQQPGRSIALVHRPATIDAALSLLAEDESRLPLAGGTDLLLDLQRGGPGDRVEMIDLTAIDGFDRIDYDGERFVLGGGVRHGQIVADPRFIEFATPLAQACLEIGSPQLRNRATIAGNLATASPANDSLSALMALDASVELARWSHGGTQTRIVRVADFFTGFRSTVMAASELITSITVPHLDDDQRGIWVKLGNRRAQAISVIHAAFVLTRDDQNMVTAARLAFGSVAATVCLSEAGAAALVGSALDDDAIARSAAAVADEFSPIDDVRATAEYRKTSLSTIVTRSLEALGSDRHVSAWPALPPQLRNRAREGSIEPPASTISNETSLSITVNGTEVVDSHAAEFTLLDWLRVRAGLDGSKEGCAEGECGACTVQLNGAAVMSCLVSAGQADGGTVVTVEGLANGEDLHPLQQAFIDEFAVQCGFCIPGFLVAGASLLDEVDQPDDEQIKLALSGNLCRCTGYYPMIEAVKRAAAHTSGGSGR